MKKRRRRRRRLRLGEEETRLEIGTYTFILTKNPNGTYKSEPLPQIPDEGIPLPYIPKSNKTLAVFESESNPGKKHYVILPPSGEIFCTCFGFRAPNHCWHYRWVMDMLKEIPIESITEPMTITRKS